MNKLVFSACLSVIANLAIAQERPEPNSRYFDTAGYIYPQADGNWTKYNAKGYVQKGAANTRPMVFILPQVHLDEQSIEFIGNDGIPFDPADEPTQDVKSIVIRAVLDRSMPMPTQEPAIAGAILGQPQKYYIGDIWKGPNGPNKAMDLMQYGFNVVQAVDQVSLEQSRHAMGQVSIVDSVKNYIRTPVSIDGMELVLTIDGDDIAQRSFSGSLSTGGRLPAMKINDPTRYQVGRLISGGAELIMRYKFKDSKTSQIEAEFDTELLINRFLEVHRQMVTRQSSAGIRILGISFRRRSVRQSVNQYVNSNFSGSLMERTVIVMDDANDGMISRFENAFFPILSRQETIDNHLAAAEKARNEGNTQLANTHQKYADSLTASLDFDSVDMAKAAAALAAQDYASFLAAGVRAGSDSSVTTSEFRKLDRSQTNISQNRGWLEAQRITVSRQVSSIIQYEEKEDTEAVLGMCGAAEFTYVERISMMPYPPIQNAKKGMLATCVNDGGPLAQAGIPAGSVIMSIDGIAVYNEQRLRSVLNSRKPGDRVSVRVFRPQMTQPSSGSQGYQVKLFGRPKLD